MKCPYCGGEVALEDKSCPFCGRSNEQSARHQRDMERYQRRYASTERLVTGKAKTYGRVLPRAVILMLLLFATVVMIAVGSMADRFPENARRRAAERDLDRTVGTIEGYLAQRDYAALASYVEYMDLHMYGKDELYRIKGIVDLASNYSYLLERIENIYLVGDRESWRKWSMDNDLRGVCGAVASFLDNYDRLDREELTEQELGWLEQMRADFGGMIAFYLGIDEASLTDFLAMSEARRAVYLEEVLFGDQN